ncbi:MAG: Holliday junction branch migration protein RuvA [Planctomycetota bacterium]
MYEYLSGELVFSGDDFAVVETGGVGYRLRIPRSTAGKLREGAPVRLFVSHRFRDDLLHLYGFATRAEREIFERVCAVSGVGPGVALSILSGIPIDEFRAAIQNDQAKILEAIRGIGKKTAQRLVLELKEVVGPPVQAPVPPKGGRREEDLVKALIAIGFPAMQAVKAVREVIGELPPDTSVDALSRAAIRAAHQLG